MYSLLPFWYFGGVLALILVGCILVLLWTGKRRALGLWIFWTCVIYTILFWGVITATTGIDRDYILSAKWRHTPGSEPGTSNLVTLEYLAYPDCYERVNSPRIYQYLISKNSEFATITLRVSYDFGG